MVVSSRKISRNGRRTTYMTERVGPLPFCPGCGHGPLLRALDRALVALGPDPEKVVIVTDIGCIGLSDRHFDTGAFHGLHGRSITYASGMKLARPELEVIVLMGDGGCGIGGTHLLNAARRNIGITLLVANNFNYGMTGGQHSVTTPTGGITSSTPLGNIEAPMDLCATVAASGGSWVCRATVFDPNLAENVAAAIEQPGFSMLEVIEPCTAYYAPRNQMRKKEFLALLQRLHFKLGICADNPRPEYSARRRERMVGMVERKSPRGRRPSIDARFAHTVRRQTALVLAGGAGQKVRSAAAHLARGAMYAGLQATQKDDYPITVQTGHSVSELVLSPQPIAYTGIDQPDIIVVISEHGLKRIRARLQAAPERCTIYADAAIALPDTAAAVRPLELARLKARGPDLSPAVAALGAVLADTEWFPLQAVITAIRKFSDPALAGDTVEALRAGAALV